ncbi:MAG: hypothetical protein KDB88_06455 [Flavobacteriales bacterium]|nr:hypothetical protein [Flavobacteriales bacterium]
MSQIVERLQDVQQRVSELLADRAQLRERISRIGSSEREHERQIEVLHVRIAELEKENEVLRSSSHAPGKEEDDLDAKLKIEELVNEIDRCLALLNN